MSDITSIAALEALYGPASKTSRAKVVPQITPAYQRWIEGSRFCILSTVGPDGTDGTPRGDDGPVVRVADPKTILMPDWQGNNRLDSLRNIVLDGRVSLMFMVPGRTEVIRVNGTARLRTDAALTGQFEQRGKHPKSVVVVQVAEAYFQCAKSLMRSGLWGRGDDGAALPKVGELLRDADGFDADADSLDAYYQSRLPPESLW